MVSGTELDPEELELLRAIALGECNFRPAAGESDMQWLRRRCLPTDRNPPLAR